MSILRTRLLPLADLITPNIEEAAMLAGADPLPPVSAWESAEPQIRELAARLHALGARGVLITGGHLAEPVDFLSIQQPDGDRLVHDFAGKHLDSRSTHGTGCALATALACLLARGTDPVAAVAEAKEYVRQAIRQAEPLGKGRGADKASIIVDKACQSWQLAATSGADQAVEYANEVLLGSVHHPEHWCGLAADGLGDCRNRASPDCQLVGHLSHRLVLAPDRLHNQDSADHHQSRVDISDENVPSQPAIQEPAQQDRQHRTRQREQEIPRHLRHPESGEEVSGHPRALAGKKYP